MAFKIVGRMWVAPGTMVFHFATTLIRVYCRPTHLTLAADPIWACSAAMRCNCVAFAVPSIGKLLAATGWKKMLECPFKTKCDREVCRGRIWWKMFHGKSCWGLLVKHLKASDRRSVQVRQWIFCFCLTRCWCFQPPDRLLFVKLHDIKINHMWTFLAKFRSDI